MRRILIFGIGLVAIVGCGSGEDKKDVNPAPSIASQSAAAATTTTTTRPPAATTTAAPLPPQATTTTTTTIPLPPTTVAPLPVPLATPIPTHVPDPPAVPAPSLNFKSCAEAKAAGAAPMRRGEPGYRPALDRDGDGIACDK